MFGEETDLSKEMRAMNSVLVVMQILHCRKDTEYGKAYDETIICKRQADVCIIVAVNHRKYDLGDIDEILENQGLTKLSKGIE